MENEAAVETLATSIIDDLFEESEPDPVSVSYSLWVNLIHVLVESGWTEEELTKDLIWHARNQLQQETH